MEDKQEQAVPTPVAPAKRTTCKKCPAFYNPCLWKGAGSNSAHWIVVGLSPSGFTIGNGIPFSGDDGRLFKKLVTGLPDLTGKKQVNNGLQIYYTYAVLNGPVKPNKEMLDCCIDNLRREISLVQGIDGREPVIIALGPDVTRALGVRAKKIDDILGRFATTSIPTAAGLRTFQVLPLLSISDLNRRQGAVGTINSLLIRAAQMALGIGDTTVYRADAPEQAGQSVKTPAEIYRTPKTIEEVRALVEEIRSYTGNPEIGPNAWFLAVDTETNTLSMHKPDAKILMISLAWDMGKAASIMLDHPETPYDREEAWACVRSLLEGEKPKAFHNTKFDYQGLFLKYGIQVNNIRWDTLLGEHWIDEDKKGLYGLKKLTPMYVPTLTGYDDELQKILRGKEDQEAKELKKSVKTVSYVDSLGDDGDDGEEAAPEVSEVEPPAKAKKKKKDIGFQHVPMDTLLQYAATDADVTRRIVKAQKTRLDKLQKTSEANHVMAMLYLPASKTLAKMEYTGFKVDKEYLGVLEQDIIALRDTRLDELRRNFDPSANYNSHPQVQVIMQRLGFEALPYKAFGTTDKEALTAYSTQYGLSDPRGKFAMDLLAYRTANDAKSKFINKIKLFTAPHDSCIHTSFHLAGTATGRLSSSGPNLQNIPKQICRLVHKDISGTETVVHKGFNAKKLFIPSNPDNILCNMDIQAAELRVYTAYSKDQKMIDALIAGTDVHSMVASTAYGVPYEEIRAKKGKDARITKMRDNAKRVVFGVFYGAGAKKIAEQIGGTKADGQRLIDMLFATFPDLAKYIQVTRGEVKNWGFVRTYFGRYRRFKMANISNKYFEAACREAINMKVQSTASDLLLSQLIEMDANIWKDIGGRLIITVHDSIVLELPRVNEPLLKPFLTKYITERVKEKFAWLPAPFAYDHEIGDNYGELKAVK